MRKRQPNFVNNQPIDSFTDKSIVSSSPSPSDNKHYYLPETYKKTTQKIPRISLYVSTYSYPNSLTTTSTTTKPITEKLNDNSAKNPKIKSSKEYNEAETQSLSPSYIPNNSQNENRPMDVNHNEKHREVPVYYDDSDGHEMNSYHPIRNRNRHYFSHDFHRDLSSMQTLSHIFKGKKTALKPLKLNKKPIEEPIVQKIKEDSSYSQPDYKKYNQKYYEKIGNYPPYRENDYMSHNHQNSDDTYSLLTELKEDFLSLFGANSMPQLEEDLLSPIKTASWLGPGVAGLLIGILPLASIVASLIPAFVSVPVISTSPISRRRRSTELQDAHIFNNSNTELFLTSVFNTIERYGVSTLNDSKCFQEMFCTFTAEGRNERPNLLQNLLYLIAEW